MFTNLEMSNSLHALFILVGSIFTVLIKIYGINFAKAIKIIVGDSKLCEHIKSSYFTKIAKIKSGYFKCCHNLKC